MRKVFAALLALHCGAAAAEPLDAETLANCLVEKSSDVQTGAIKKLMIAAFQDDVPAMQKYLLEFGTALVSLAMSDCGVGPSQLSDPAFEAASSKYGEVIGERLINEAFAKLK